MNMKRQIKRGDIYHANLDNGIGSEQKGGRPVLIISNDMGNYYSRTVIAAVITSSIESKSNLPTHFFIKTQQRLMRDSIVLLEQIKTIDKIRLSNYLGTLDNETMVKINDALAVSVGLKGENFYE